MAAQNLATSNTDFHAGCHTYYIFSRPFSGSSDRLAHQTTHLSWPSLTLWLCCWLTTQTCVLEFPGKGQPQNVVFLMDGLVWWQWKYLQSLGLIKCCIIRSRVILVHHMTVLLSYNILWQKVQNVFWTRINARRASIAQRILDLELQKSG